MLALPSKPKGTLQLSTSGCWEMKNISDFAPY